jgi:hypothetical protein
MFHKNNGCAECFKYRNTIGMDVAIEALKDVLRRKKATIDEIQGGFER